MNNLSTNTIQTMSSLEIANLTGKPHNDVLKDIRRILAEVEIDQGQFSQVYKAKNGQNQPCFSLPRRECDLVIAGYSAKYRLAIIDRWQELESVSETSKLSLLPKATEAFNCYLTILNRIDITGNAATISANQATVKATGINFLEDLGCTHLLAEKQEITYTPTQIGEMINLSARAVNNVLCDIGLQIKVNQQWVPTESAIGLFEVLDTGKRHGNGVPVKQIKWFKSIIEKMNKSANGI